MRFQAQYTEWLSIRIPLSADAVLIQDPPPCTGEDAKRVNIGSRSSPSSFRTRRIRPRRATR